MANETKYKYKYNEAVKLGKRVCKEMLGTTFCQDYDESASFDISVSKNKRIIYCGLTLDVDKDIYFSKCQIDRIDGTIIELRRDVPDGKKRKSLYEGGIQNKRAHD